MNKKARRKIDQSSKYMVFLVIFLIIINAALGALLAFQSSTSMKAQINGRMLDIANTAAAMTDGDSLKNAKPGTPEYDALMKLLTYFQKSIELKYIYCVLEDEDRNFVFGADPTVDDPGEFGSPVVSTAALRMASNGTPSVDDVPYSDKWGTFYSAYSPVFDSTGRITGIIAVDFSKEWYDRPVTMLIYTALIATISSLLIAAILVIILTSKNRSRIRIVNHQLNELAENFEKLMQEVKNMSGISSQDTSERCGVIEYEGDDDIESMRMKLLSLQDELYIQIENVKAQAYIDGMTGVRNKASYLNTEKMINEAIKSGKAAFAVVICDMNGLKHINDTLGHEYGDMAITDATKVLSSVFDIENIYRIGGDEFIVIIGTASETEIQNSISRLEYQIAASNTVEKPYKSPLSIAVGYSLFRQGEDTEYKDVFHRADKMMYEDKTDYYAKHGDLRRKR